MADATFQGEPVRVSLKSISIDPSFNARSIMDGIDRLAEDIKRNGQDTPVLVRPEKGGTYFLLAGFRRMAALKLLKAPTVLALVKTPETDMDSYLINLRENIARKSLTTFDVAMRCKLLRDRFKMTGEQIGTLVTKSIRAGDNEEGEPLQPKYVNQLIRAATVLPEKILTAWKEPSHPRHAVATTDNLKKISAGDMSKKEREEMWEGLALNKANEIASGSREPQEGKERIHKPGPKVIQAALKSVPDSRAGESFRDGVTAALRWVLGMSKTIPNIYDPEAVKRAEKDRKDAEKAKEKAKEEAKSKANTPEARA